MLFPSQQGKGERMDTIAILQDILAYIDAHIGEELSLERLAARAGFSTFHFCRMFRWGAGYSAMEYVRLRRLAFAAHALQSGARILDIALACGFETHSGFSKAFRRHFGCPPEIYRRHAASALPKLPDLARNHQYAIGGIVMEPKFVTLPQRKIAGYAIRAKSEGGENMNAVPAFWNAYMSDGRCEKLHMERFVKNHAEYGACFQEDPETGEFDYVIGVAADDDAAVPEGYAVYALPAATYAVFSTPPCDAKSFVPAIQGVWQFAFNEWFPQSGYEYAPGCADFELYDERCMSESGKVCEIYIPVIKKSE